MRRLAFSAVLLMLASAASAQPAAPPANYGDHAAWLCRPGKEAVCTTGLDALAVG